MNYSFVGERVFHSGMSAFLPAQEGASCPKICAPSELPSCGELTRIHGAHAPTAHLKNQLDPVLSRQNSRANPEKKWLFFFQHRVDRRGRLLRRAHRLDHRRCAGGDISAGVDVGDRGPAVPVDDDVPDVPFVALTNRRKSPFRRFDSFPCGEAAQQSPTAARTSTPDPLRSLRGADRMIFLATRTAFLLCPCSPPPDRSSHFHKRPMDM